ncbi:Cyclin-like F-box protein [Rutstroemia sp. NJR-2017a WRK4]|nr:Cyclin-like F-box protein [Rutstroemia sp. NJR-2017a WRK4]
MSLLWHWRSLERTTGGHPKHAHTSYPDSEADTNTNSLRLSDLPPELIIIIASFLPTQSAACLSLCSRAMSQILGSDAWRCLKIQSPGVRATFLSDLSKDLPQYFVCYLCVQLHTTSAVQWPRSSPKTLTRCLRKELALKHCSQSGIYLRFPHIQLVMNRHYLGPSHGFPLEAFQTTEVIESDIFRNIVLLSVEAQIVSDELLMRSQQWVLLPHNRRDKLVTRRLFHHLCHHIWALGRRENNLPTLIKSRLDLLDEQGQCCTSTGQCLKCPMDFVLDVVDLGERGIAGCLTRWTNLGAGLHPEDPKWRSHLGKSLPRGVTYEPHHLGSIRSSFENQTAIPFVEFTSRNIYDLLSRRERKHITRREDGFIWKLVYNDPYRWCIEHAGQSLEWDIIIYNYGDYLLLICVLLLLSILPLIYVLSDN